MKKLCCLLLSLIFLFLLCGCNDSPTHKDISEALWGSGAFGERDVYRPLDREQVKNYFSALDSAIDESSVYISAFEDNATEFGIFTLRSDGDLKTVIDSINSYCATAAASFGTHGEGKEKLLLMRVDDTVIYLITDKPDAAVSALEKLGADEIN